jgi:hypothetical protein
MERSPEHLCNGSKIRFDLFIVISLTHEAFRGNYIRGSYFYRKLVAVPKRPSPETDTDSTSDGSTKFHHEDQPAKKRKKRASKKHDDDISGRMQGSPENNTSKAQSAHLEDMESDPESSIFMPQDENPALPLTMSADNYFEAFNGAEADRLLVFSKGSASPSSARAGTSDCPVPQCQRAGALRNPYIGIARFR